jgi:hypothetical protein
MNKCILCITSIILLIAIVTFGQSKPSSGKYRSDNIITEYYDSISKFDFKKLREICSKDFQLVEESGVYSLEDHIGFLKPDSGKIKVEYSIENILLKKEEMASWLVYTKTTKIITENKNIIIKSRETAISTYKNGWEIRLVHSTRMK